MMTLRVSGSLFSGFFGLVIYFAQRSTEADMFPPGLGASEIKEFCHFTRFEVTCALDQVLLFHRALYGRMRVGTCVRTNFGFVGCFVDVLDVLDQRCGGRRSCTFDVVEPTFENRRPCNVELKNYLEVEYTCITVANVPPGSCETSISATNSLPLNRHDTKKCGTTSHPWRIIAPRLGQRINVTLVDLSNTSMKEPPPSSISAAGCQRYVTVSEPLRHTSRDVCVRRSLRENFVYTSESEMVELVFNTTTSNSGEFLLFVTAAGCPDLPSSRGFLVKYSADRSSADVGCSELTDGLSWHLICMEQQWAGHLGNCSTDASDSSSVASSAGKHDYFKLNAATMVVLWLVVSSSISLSVLLLGLLIHRQIKKRRRKTRSRGDHVTTEDCVTPPEDQPEVHHTSSSCHVYHAFLHKGLFTSVGFQPQPSKQQQQRPQANCVCVCKTCAGSPCIRQAAEQLIVVPKDDEDDGVIKTGGDTAKSLLMAVEHCPRCCTHRLRENDYE